MTYEHFVKEYITDGKTYTSIEVTALVQQAWTQAVDEQVQLEGRCINRKTPWSNCKNHDYHFAHHDCPSPPDRECTQDCLHRCHQHQSWQASGTG